MNDAVVRIKNVTRQYAGAVQPAVSHLNLDISKGNMFGLLGPNGAGKSTLVMMICGLLKPDSGSVEVFGMDVKQHGAAIRKKIGVATQEIALFPSLTARENLHYFGKLYGLKSDHIKKNIAHYLDAFGLRDKADKRVSTFSGGMKRRVNLIAALLHEPLLLILDEPTAGVDVQSRNLILNYLLSLQSRETTIIYSSHFLEEAEKICKEIVILDEGKMVAQGSCSSLLTLHNDCKNLEEFFLKITGKQFRD